MKILIIEDEYNLADAISSRLEKEKFIVSIIGNGKVGLNEALTNVYDLIILDVMLPGMDGFSILKSLREENITSKIIMLTAKSTIEDKLEGLENGADDYLTKPFHIDELIARINIQLKRNNKTNSSILKYNDIELDINKSKLKCINTCDSIDLLCKEFLLLEYFINNKEIILNKEQIKARIWGIDNETESNNLEVYLTFLRRKLKAIGSNTTIKAIRNLGYKLEAKDEKTKQ